MAGLFGLFNYEKEGPGIDKNAPKKHTFIVFFETFFRNFWKFLPINIVYCLLCVPLFTNGFANVGITNVARNIARDKHSFGLSDFFETIKKNKKQGLIAGIINLAVYILMAVNFAFYWLIDKGILSIIGLSLTFAFFFVFTVMSYYVWTLIITFKFTLKQAYMNSFRFVFINLIKNALCFFTNLIILAFNAALLWFLNGFFFIVLAIEIFAFILIYPSFNALLIQFCTFESIKKCIIDPYYAEHPDEDLDKRHDLGVDDAKNEDGNDGFDDEEDSDVIFTD